MIIKSFKLFESSTILDEKIENYLPKSLEIVTSNGRFSLTKCDLTREIDILRVSYWHSTHKKTGSVLSDGEPDYLELDIHFTKSDKGLKILIDVTYGDFMASEFSISGKNKVSIINYNGVGSKLDPKSHFGFSKKSLESLISFFNRFGFSLKLDQFKFIDEFRDTYHPKSNIQIPTAKD
jgi:hypothetical protein